MMKQTAVDAQAKPQAKIRRQFVDTECGQIHLRLAQNPSAKDLPLVCLHQTAKSSREFARFVALAAADRCVVAPDNPGYGESDLPPAEPPVQIADYARILWQALDQLGLEVVDLFGHHTGSSIAVEMAHQQPDRVRHIAMISAPVLNAEERDHFMAQFEPVPLDEAGTRFTHIWEAINTYRSPGMTLDMMAESFAENLRSGNAYEWGHRAAIDYGRVFASNIAELNQKILVLNPADLLHDVTARVAPYLKNGTVMECPQWSSELLNIYTADVYELIKNYFRAKGPSNTL